MAITNKRIALDLGSERTRIYLPRKGIVVDQPTIIARDDQLDKIVAVGDEAAEMAGRSPDTISILRPLKAGVIADYGAATTLLKQYLQQASGRFQLKRPVGLVSVSDSATSTERRALIDACREAGLQEAHLIKSALAAALGAGLPITEPRGNTVIDIGAGTTEIGVFSLGGTVASHAIRVGGGSFDDAIERFMRREHGVQIGGDEIYRIKSEFVDLDSDNNHTLTVHGRSILQGVPKNTTIKLHHLQSYLDIPLERIVIAVRRVFEMVPPDLLGDIIKHGIVLTGGGSQIKGLESYLSKRLRVAFLVAADPSLCVIKGAHISLTHLEDYQRSLVG